RPAPGHAVGGVLVDLVRADAPLERQLAQAVAVLAAHAGAAGPGVLAVGHRIRLGGVGVVAAAAERVAARVAALADGDHRAVGDAGGHVDVLLLVAGAVGLDGGAIARAVRRRRH